MTNEGARRGLPAPATPSGDARARAPYSGAKGLDGPAGGSAGTPDAGSIPAASTTSPCEDCGGTGWMDGRAVAAGETCWPCGGTGRVTDYVIVGDGAAVRVRGTLITWKDAQGGGGELRLKTRQEADEYARKAAAEGCPLGLESGLKVGRQIADIKSEGWK